MDLEALGESIRERQITQVLTQKKTQNLKNEALDLATNHANVARKVEDDIHGRRAHAENERRLQDSGDLGDRLRLGALRILDPANYTAEGRATRNAQDASYLELLGKTKNIQLEQLDAELSASQSGLEQAKLKEMISLERAKELTQFDTYRTEELQASRQLQQETLAGQDDKQIRLALQNAAGSDTVDINGVAIRSQFVRETLTAREDAILASEVARTTTDNSMRRLAHEKMLTSKSKEHLLELRRNGYKDSDGTQYDADQVDGMFTRKEQVEADWISNQITEHNNKFLPANLNQRSAVEAKRLQDALPANSPMQAHANQWLMDVGAAQEHIEKGDSQVALQIMQQGQKTYLDQAAKQAKLDSNGDKDVEALLFQYYTSGQADSAGVIEVGAARLVKGQSIANLVPPERASQAVGIYQTRRKQLFAEWSSAQGAQGIGTRPDSAERKRIEQQAAQDSMNQLIQVETESLHQMNTLGQVNAVQQLDQNGSVILATHPLNGKYTAEAYGGLQARSQNLAVQQVANSLGVDPSILRTALSTGELIISDSTTKTKAESKGGGNTQTAVDMNAVREQINYLTHANIATQLGEETARDVIRWQEQYGSRYVTTMLETAASDKKGFAESNVLTLAKQNAQDRWLQYSAGFSQAADGLMAETANQIRDFYLGSNPIEYQAVLLGVNQHLTQEERSVAWGLITPIVEAVTASGLKGEEARSAIERGVGALETETPLEKKVVKAMMRSRLEDMERLQDLMGGMFFMKQGLTQSGNLRTSDGQVRQIPMWGSTDGVIHRSATNLKFYSDWAKTQQRK